MKRERVIKNVLYLFIVLHVLAWTLAPSLVRFTLPMDAMEGATWGHQLAWGYDKNPFLNAWLTRLALTLGGQWTVYLFAQLSVAVCFWAVFRLGCAMMPPLYALMGVLLLEGLQYYNFHAIDFNDNTLELGLWAVLVLFFYHAVRDKKMRDWLCVGFFAGLSLMTKYYTAMLLVPLFLFLLTDKKTRSVFSDTGIYAAFLVCLLISTPHIIWLFSHEFVTVQYALARTGSELGWWSHIRFPFGFLWQQCLVLLPGLVLLLPLGFGKATPIFAKMDSMKRFDRRFLLFAGMGPLIMTVLLSIMAGIKLRAGWGQPLLSYSGLMLMMQLRPVLTRRRVRNFGCLLAVLLTVAVSGYGAALMRAPSPSSAIFPGKVISEQLEGWWHAHYAAPLRYVVGPRWYAGNVAFYSAENPAVYMEADSRVSPWIDMTDLRKKGALFVWEKSDTAFEARMRQRFPELTDTRIFWFQPARNAGSLQALGVAVALLPPDPAFTFRGQAVPEAAHSEIPAVKTDF